MDGALWLFTHYSSDPFSISWAQKRHNFAFTPSLQMNHWLWNCHLAEQGWWDSLWRHTNACRTLTLSVLKLNVVRTAVWDWPSRQGRLTTRALLPYSPGLPLVCTSIHPPREPFEMALPGPGWNNAWDHCVQPEGQSCSRTQQHKWSLLNVWEQT